MDRERIHHRLGACQVPTTERTIQGRTRDHYWCGPGGLAAALLLAKAGVQVKIIERRAQVGGRTSTLEFQGFRFDVGPTFFLYPKILAEIFAAVGADLQQEVRLLRLDPQYRLVLAQGENSLPHLTWNAWSRLLPR